MNITIKTIAKLAGVSPAAVSKALNGYPDIGKETRENILRICEESGYTRNAVARNLVKKSTTMLGLMIPDISTPIYTEIFKGLDAEAKRRGFYLFLCDSNRNKDFEKSYITTLMENRACGIIVAPVANDVEHIIRMTRNRIPVVFIGGKISEEMGNYVATDNMLGSRLAVDYLAGLGHTKICMICDNYGTKTKQDRIRGFREAMAERSLDPVVLMSETDVPDGLEHGYTEAMKLFDSGRPCTAVYTSSDMVALGVMKAAKERRIPIPGKLSLVGYDDIMFASLPSVMLTTIAQPRFEIGVLAVELLCRAMADKDTAATHRATVKPSLVIRDTCRSIRERTKVKS